MSNESIPNTGTPVIQITGAPPAPGQIATYQNQANAGIQTRFTMDLNQDALISIAVAESEKKIRARIAELNKVVTTCTARFNALVGQRDSFLSTWTREQAKVSKDLTQFLAGVTALFAKNPRLSYDNARYEVRRHQILGSIIISWDSNNVPFEFATSPSDEFVKLLTDIDAATKALETAKSEVLTARSALSNVDALERQAKAQMAAKVAEQSGEEGRALVESIRSTVDADSLIETLRS